MTRRDAAPWNGLADRRLGDNVKTSVPGIGPVLARRLHEELEIATLEDLEVSAWGSRAAYNRDQSAGALRGERVVRGREAECADHDERRGTSNTQAPRVPA